jgi:hypothetical protein
VTHRLCAHVTSFLVLMEDAADMAAPRKLELMLGRN